MVKLSCPDVGWEEINNLRVVIQSGQLAQGGMLSALEDAWARYTGARYAIAVSSGTTALYAAMLALGIGPGDEVITTPFTFVATSNMIVAVGATPVFVDIDFFTFCISPENIELAITPRTKAILPVHLYGHPANMDAIMDIARRYKLHVIEDCAQAMGARLNGRHVGTFGDMGCFSLYATKNISAGEGGMITTNNEELTNAIRLIRNHGQTKRYKYVRHGWNFRMSELSAAVAIPQINKIDNLLSRRREIARLYFLNTTNIMNPTCAPGTTHAFNYYTIRSIKRNALASVLYQNGFETGIFYPEPLRRGLHEADAAAREVLSLPMHTNLSNIEVLKICKIINGEITK